MSTLSGPTTLEARPAGGGSTRPDQPADHDELVAWVAVPSAADSGWQPTDLIETLRRLAPDDDGLGGPVRCGWYRTGAASSVRPDPRPADQPTGDVLLQWRTTESAPLTIDIEARTVELDGTDVELTMLEFDLLHHMVTHADRVLTREHLLRDVWHLHYTGSNRTVDVHVARLRRKLGQAVAPLLTVRGVGYRWRSALTLPVEAAA